MKTFTSETRVIRKPDLVAAEMDGDIVLMSIQQGEYFGISSIGPKLWELLEQPVTVTQTVDVICAEYETSPETCAADVTTFVSALLHNNLIAHA